MCLFLLIIYYPIFKAISDIKKKKNWKKKYYLWSTPGRFINFPLTLT